MESPSISVVIPLFNKGNCIERAWRSIREQTLPCQEIIVVDDGSTDGGHRVVERLEDPRIKLFRQANQGPSAARNQGIAEAQGDLIAFLDADDEWKPQFLETVHRLRAHYPQAGAYATAYEVQEPNGQLYVSPFREIPPAPWEGLIPNYFRSATRSCSVWTSAMVVRKEVFGTVGCFVLCPGVGEDLDLWGRIALRYPIAFSWQIGAVYHREAENRQCETVFAHVFTSGNFERVMRSQEIPAHLLPDVEEFLADQKLIAASTCVRCGHQQAARRILKNCRTHRFHARKLWWWFWSLLPYGLMRLAWRIKRWFRRCRGSWNCRPCHPR